MKPIKTVYYDRRAQPLQINRSMDPNRAVAQCVLHMQINHYGASAAEVYDNETGELHAAIKRSIQGNLSIVYQRNPQDFERRYAIGFLFDVRL
jgi:hypothetical protein